MLEKMVEHKDIPKLLEELVEYVNTTEDHPLIIAGVVHYQLVTIHPFEDGNGRTDRLLSGYLLDYYGYGFGGIGSLEEYFAYDSDELAAGLSHLSAKERSLLAYLLENRIYTFTPIEISRQRGVHC